MLYPSACRTLETAQKLIGNLPDCRAISLDVNSTPDLEREIAAHDLVISLVPYIYHAAVIKAAIKSKTNVVTTSYVSPAMRELDEEAKKAGIVVMNEIGVDPGIDHIYAIKTIDEVHEKGGKVKIVSYFPSTMALTVWLDRSRSSTCIVVPSPHPNVPITLSATSFRGHPAVVSSPSPTPPPTSLKISRSTLPAKIS